MAVLGGMIAVWGGLEEVLGGSMVQENFKIFETTHQNSK